MSVLDPELDAPAAPENGNGSPLGEPSGPLIWKTDSAGREYIPKPQGRGMIYRKGGESVAEALENDAKPKDPRPKRKTKAPKMPQAPRKLDLKELEHTLAEALKSPAMICAGFGDEWAANHFTTSGPYLARNLVLASEHNDWLRKKLEDAATGQDAAMKVLALVPVAGALFAYAIPPVVYWFNLPVPPKTREMFGIPPRKEKPPEYASPADPETDFPA